MRKQQYVMATADATVEPVTAWSMKNLIAETVSGWNEINAPRLLLSDKV